MSANSPSSADYRSRLYERMVWRNRVIGVMRWAVPGIGIALGAVLIVQIVIANMAVDYGLSGIGYDQGQIVLEEPRYGGIMQSGDTYEVVADAARIQVDNTNLIDLDHATIITHGQQDYTMTANANAAQLDLGSQQVRIEDVMTIVDSDGVEGTLVDALIDWPSQTLTASGPVRFDFLDGAAIDAQSLVYDAGASTWDFGQPVYTTPLQPSDAEPDPNIVRAPGQQVARDQISAARFLINEPDRRAEFSGDVVVDQADAKVWTDRLVVYYGAGGLADVENFEALGHVRMQTETQTAVGDHGVYNPLTQVMHMQGDVRVQSASGTIDASQMNMNLKTNVTQFTSDAGERVHGSFEADDPVTIVADSFVFQQDEGLADFTGDVALNQPDLGVRARRVIVHLGRTEGSDIELYEAIGNVRVRAPGQTATGDRGVYNPATRIMRLSGNVQVTTENGVVNAPELLVDLATNVSQFTSNPTNGSSGTAGGRVTGVFTQDN